MAWWHVEIDGSRRWARGAVDEGPRRLVATHPSLDDLLGPDGGGLEELAASADDGPVPEGAIVLAPIGTQDVWAAGVTYERSRAARTEESAAPDPYDLVYEADRPELFMKAAGGRVRGPGDAIAIRSDSDWDVPEPELGVLVDTSGEIVAYLLGDDMSSRSIEGENPLYLPQAKVYDGSCSLGPCLVPRADLPDLDEVELTLTIERDGDVASTGATSLASLRRRPDDLVGWLFAALSFPAGAVLLTGTGIVPDSNFTLQGDDVVRIAGTGLGELTNTVEVLDTTRPRRPALQG